MWIFLVDGQPRASIVLGVMSWGLCRSQRIKRAQRKKWLFWVSSLGTIFWVLPKAPGKHFGVLLDGSGTSFSGLRQKVCAVCEKVCSQTVSWIEEQRSSIAKACKPYSTSFKNRRCASDGLTPHTCVPTVFILGLKSLLWRLQTVSRIMFFWDLL